MKLSQLKLVPLAAAMALMGAAGSANAGAYGYSYLDVFNLVVSNTGPLPTNIVTTNTTSNIAGLLNLPPPAAQVGSLDALEALVGTAPAHGQNTFNRLTTAVNVPPFVTYSRADGQIVSTQFPLGTGDGTAQAVGVAEAHVANSNTATATAQIGSTTGITITETVGAGTQIQFNFQAFPFLAAIIAGGATGTTSAANLTATITITNNGTGAQVFNWAPDGNLATQPTGGTSSLDGADLNHGTSVSVNPASSFFDPSGCGGGTIGPLASQVSTTPDPGTTPGTGTGKGCGALFAAISNPLAAGNYTFRLNFTDSVEVTKVVPAPGTIALLGLGLAGLGFASRRKPV